MMILVAGALLGFISIAFGSYAAHGLQAGVPDETFRSIMTAIRYNQVHAVVVTAMGLALLRQGHAGLDGILSRVAWLFTAGTILFSFTIYLSALTGIPALTRLTPVGGILLMAAWLGLAWTGLKSVTGSAR